MPNLFPEGYENEVIRPDDLVSNRPIGYKGGALFDYELGDFARDGKKQIMNADGIESWKAWCVNCVLTQRYKYLGYSTDFGIELDKVFAAPSREAAENILTRQITEAILADDYGRCEYIERIDYEWTEPDGVRVRAILHGIEDVTIDVTAYLTNQGGEESAI